MRITLILPSIGKKEKLYIKSWQMQPLSMAILKALIPKDIDVKFYDDRLEKIPYEEPTDLVAISVETFTARRAYTIANEYRKKGIKVVLGGFHPTLLPDEAKEYADSVLIGEAEMTFLQVIDDLKNGSLKKFYYSKGKEFHWVKPDRSIFNGKKYFNLNLIESGRGCVFNCDFCTITKVYNEKYRPKPVKDVINEIKELNSKYVFIVDDNITANKERATELFRNLIPLKIKWISQASMDITLDEDFLNLMRESGCVGLLIGFESLNIDNLKQMNKNVNQKISIKDAINKIHHKNIVLYGAFVLGYDFDTLETLQQTLDFTKDMKLFMVAYNHLMPFPATPLYDRLKKENRLVYEKWWLDENYNFYDVAFKPKNLTAEELSECCITMRKEFYGYNSILKRLFTLRHWQSVFFLITYLSINLLLKKEINHKHGIPLGIKR